MPAESADRSSLFTSASVPDAYERLLAPVVFEPWAEILLDAVKLAAGSRVLDVASGTGVVARAAARRAGPHGYVVASDVSEPMLGRAASPAAGAGSAPIERRQAPADALPFEDVSFDVVLCQQGLQFFPERAAAVSEMRRVLRPGGTAGAAVWAAGHPLEPFGAYGDELAAIGAEPPFPRAFDSDTFAMDLDALQTLFEDAGFGSVDAQLVECELRWPDAGSAAAGVQGTPFAPLVAALAPETRERYYTALAERFAPEEPGAEVRRVSVAVVVRATS